MIVVFDAALPAAVPVGRRVVGGTTQPSNPLFCCARRLIGAGPCYARRQRVVLDFGLALVVPSDHVAGLDRALLRRRNPDAPRRGRARFKRRKQGLSC